MTSLNRLIFSTQQANTYNIWKLLEIRRGIAVSSARFLHKTLLKLTSNREERYKMYRKFRGEIFRHKNCMEGLNRKGMIEFLTCSFRNGLHTLKKRHMGLNTLLKRVLKNLRMAQHNKISET